MALCAERGRNMGIVLVRPQCPGRLVSCLVRRASSVRASPHPRGLQDDAGEDLQDALLDS